MFTNGKTIKWTIKILNVLHIDTSKNVLEQGSKVLEKDVLAKKHFVE